MQDISYFSNLNDFSDFSAFIGISDVLSEIGDTFNQLGQGWSFTHELPSEGHLQFLDVKLTLSHSHV